MPGARDSHPNRFASEVEETILAHTLPHKARGAQRVADELMLRGVQVSSGRSRGMDPQQTQDEARAGSCGSRRRFVRATSN